MVINNKLLWTNVVTHVMIFTARQQGAVLAIGLINPSVCQSVCHMLVLYQNESNFDHAVFIGE